MKPEILNALSILESEPDNAGALAQLAAAAEGGGNGKSDPAAARAFSEARRVHRERGDFDLCIRLIDLELGWEKDPGRRADLLYEKGRLLSDELWREGDAEACFQKVLKERDGDEGATEALSHIALVREAWSKIVKKYLDEAKSATDRQLVTSLYVSVAEVYAKHQPGPEVETYLRKALEVDPRNKKAAAHLDRRLRAEERWSDVAALVESRVDQAQAREEKVALLLSLAELARDRLSRPDLALDAHRRALAIDPTNSRAMAALANAYTAEENWHGLLKLYENALKARPRGDAEIAILLQLGMVWWKKLANADQAEPHFARVKKTEPANGLMLAFYRAYHGERNEAQKLLAVLQAAQRAEQDPKRRLALGVEMAEVAEASAGNVEKAIDTWKGVLKQSPGSPEAVAALKRLYQRTEKWNALLELLKEQIEALPKDTPAAVDERVARLGEVVAIYRDKLNLDVMVINTYNTILGLKPDHAPSLAALAQKYEAMGRWNDLIGVLQRTADVTVEKNEKSRLLRRIAQLWIERFGNHNQAVKPLEELYALDPNDQGAVAQLRDIYVKRRSWRALLDLERRDLERLKGQERRAKLVDMARLAAERLGDAHEAIALWNRLLEDDPFDKEAIASLVALYEREKRWAALVEVLQRQADRSETKAGIPMLEKIGSIWAERLGAPGKAIEAYQQILRLQPTYVKAVRVLRELFAQAGDFARLEALYAENGQWEELTETLLAVAERVADVKQKIQVYQRVAEVSQKELKQPERAAKAFERILAVDPQNLGAAEKLVPIYRGGEKWARLLATYEILLGHARTDEERLLLHKEIRALCEEKLGSKQLAFTWCARAYELRPDDGALGRELERLARDADAFEELAVIYAGQIDRVTDEKDKIARLRQLGDLILSKLNRPEEARPYYAQVLERVPDDAEALAALEKIYTHTENFAELLKIYWRRAGVEKGAQRIELLFKIAWIQEEQSNDLDAAAKTYHQILAEEPSTRALRALERIYVARGNSSGLAEVLEKQLANLKDDPDSEVAISHQLGELYELRLGKPDVALAHYQRAFARTAAHRPTVAALERYLAEGNPARVEVARLLAPVYERADDAQRLAGALAILLDAARDPDEELSLLRRLSLLVGRRLGDVEGAWKYGTRIFARVPGDGQNRKELGELADLLERHQELAKLFAEAEARVAKDDPALAVELGWELGALLDDRLHQPDEAEKAWKRVVEREPRHDGALKALERHYRAAERYPELRALLAQRKHLSDDPTEKRELLFQICDLDEGVLDDPAAAGATYREVLEVDPASQRAFKALERIYSGGEKWRDLDALYDKAIPWAEQPQERAQLKLKRGDLHLNRLDDAIGACDLYEEAIADDPKCDGARKGLEKLMARPELRLRAARLLEPLYAADEAWPRLAQTLLAQREKSEGREAVELLGRIARIVEEKMGSRQQALAAWREALRLDPADEKVREQVERLATILERFSELAHAWEEAEGLAPSHDLALRADYLRDAAVIYDQRLGDMVKARAVWRRLFDLDPTNVETARPAAEALTRLYEAEEDWEHLIEVLRRQSEWAEPGEPRKEYQRRIGIIQEDLLEDHGAAVSTHREILDGDPEDRQALDALERLHAARGEWQELIDILRRRVELAKDPKARRDLLWRIAEMGEQKLHKGAPTGDVIAAYSAILDEQPEDLPALDALARLYQAAERPADLIEILERRLALATRPAERVPLRVRIAKLLEGPLLRADQALDRYREILIDEPDNADARAGLERMLTDEELRLRAAEVLEPIYQAADRGRGDTEKLIQLSELWAEHSPDPRERISRLHRIAGLRDGAGDKRAAFDALSRAARVAAGEAELPSLLDGLERLAQQGGFRAELVALYRELGPDVLDAQVQERIYLSVAAESRALGDRATSREYFRRVLDASPEHPRALDALESLYAEGRELEPLLEIYNRRAELSVGDDERRRHYLAQAAQLCEKELGRPSEAMACYEQILELYPTDAAAAQALEGLYHQSGRFADLADLLERRMGYADDIDEAVALRFRLGELYEKELRDTDRAVENYRAAMGGDPDHAGSIAALERFLSDENHRVDAAEVLEPVYAARHDWKALIRIYEIRLDAADDPQKRLGLTKRIARLYEEQLEDLDAAFRWYGKVFRENPADRAIREQLSRLAQILDAHADLAAVYEDYLHDTFEETPASIEVTRTLAAIYDGRLGDVDKAKASYLRLLAHDPNDAQAFGLLESALTRAQRWHDLLQIYRDAVDGAIDPDRRKALLFKICHVHQQQLGDPSAAIDGYRAVLEIDPQDARARAALDNLYSDGKRWHDLADLLTAQLDGASDDERVELKLRLGGLYEKELEDLPAAIDAYEEVIARDPKNREAVSSLERLILDHDQRYRIAQILEPVYQAADEWAKLVVIYDAELEFIDAKPERVALLKEIARLHAERGGDKKLAFGALCRAWSEEASESADGEEELYKSLVDLSAQLGAWRELVHTLEEVAQASYDDELKAKVHARIADVYDRRLGDGARAIDSWRKVAAIHDEDVDAWKALERLLAAAGRHAELVQVLEKRGELIAGSSGDVAEQKALAYRAADLYEHVLQQPDRAVQTWRHVLELDEDDRGALDALERLYKARKSHRELTEVYARKIELAVAEAERRPLRFAMARVLEDDLKDAFEAVSAYKAALDANPADAEALEALVRLYEREGNWPDLLDALDALAALRRGTAQYDALRFRAAKVLEEKQSEPEAAIERYKQILDDSPGDEPSRKALDVLVRRDETLDAAAAVLDPLYRARGEFAPLIELHELKLAAENDPEARRALLAAVAELYEAGVEDAAGAFATWGRLLAETPSDEEAYHQLERLAEVRASWPELAALYEQRLDAVLDPEVQRVLALKLAEIYEGRLGDEAKAISRYEKALGLPGDEMIPLEALDRLLSRAGQHRDLAEVLEKEAGAVNEPERQAAFLYRLGELRRRELADLDGALSAYRDALDREPSHEETRAALSGMLSSDAHAPAVLDILEPLADADENHAEQVRLAEVRLKHTSGRPERAGLLQRIAEICENRLRDRARALDAAARALAETPEDGQLADEVGRLGAASGKLDVAAQTFEQVLAAGVPGDTAKELGLRAGRLWDDLGDDKRAEVRYRAVLDLDGDSADALAALERIYKRRPVAEAAPRLVEVLEKRAELELDVGEKKRLFGEAAALRDRALGDADGAVGTWKKVLDADEADDGALGALAALYERASRFRDLVGVLEVRARHTDGVNELVALKGRIAALWDEKVQDTDRAVDAYRELLDAAPDPSSQMAALEHLEELHARRSDWLAVQETLVRHLGVIGAGPGQIPIYRRLAALAVEQQRSPEDAIGYYREIVELAPADPEARVELEGILEKTEKWYDLVDALRAHAELRGQVGDKDGEIALLVRAADVMQGKLDNASSATEILETILKRDPRNVRALAQLAKIYEAERDLDKCKETLERAVALSPGGADSADLYFRLGRIEEERVGEAAGEAFYQRAFEADVRHAGAIAALEKAARNRGDWAKVADLLEVRADGASEADQRACFVELAKITSEKLGDAAGAVPWLERAVQLAPEDPAILEPLADQYFAAGRLTDALPLYQKLIERLSKGRRSKELGRLHFRVGAIAERAGDLAGALAQYKSAQQIDAGHSPTLAALGRLHVAAKEWENARKIYRSMLLQNLDPSLGVSKADVYLALGEIHEALNEAPKAVGMYERGLELGAGHARLKEALARVKGLR